MESQEPLTQEDALLEKAFRIAVCRAATRAGMEAKEAPLPRSAGHHELGQELGRGGMAVVVRAHDADLDRTVALKILGPTHATDPILAARFLREARICARLQHPGIVPIHEHGRLADGRPWFSMRHVQGETLADRMERDRKDSPHSMGTSSLLSIFESVCQTMAYAHNEGVAHGDLKPANVMLGPFGEVLVLDWGLAQVDMDPIFAEPQRIMGTPAWLAPELASGACPVPNASSDVFALGAMLCEILTGAPPWQGASRLATLA